MPLTLFDFVQQVDGVTVDDIPDSTQDSIDSELASQTSGDGGGTDLSNPDDVRTVADTVSDLNGRAGFISIQDAIDGNNAKNDPNDTLSSGVEIGGSIFVEPGTYNESVVLETAGVTLRSTQGAGQTTINGTGSSGQPEAAVHIDDGSSPVRNVTVDGFKIQNQSGKYGIFAGTGSTNKSPDGIGGLVVQDNVVENISTSSTGSALTGGPAGIGIRADYGTNGNPGIEIRNNTVNNVENTSGSEPVGITLKSFDGDAGFGFDSSGDSTSDPSSPPATDTDIINNDIKNITSSDGGFATKGISVSGEFRDVNIEDNVLDTIESPGGDARAITLSENGNGPFEFDIDDDGNGERLGPQDFTIKNNEISNVNAADPRSVNVGGYERLGNHSVTGNTIDSGAVTRFAGNQDGFQPGDEDALDATGNTFTDTDAELYYSDSSDGSDLGTVFDDNTFEPDVIVGSDQIVQPPGNGTVTNIDQSTDKSSIQSAVNNASAGDTIAVGPGTFDETVNIGVDNLTLSGVLGSATSEVNEINIGQNGNSTATTGVTIRGFTIAPDSGIGIETTVEQDSNVTIEDNLINGSAGSPAAAFFQNPAGIEIRDNRFVGPDPNDPTFDNTVGDLLVVGSGTDSDGNNYDIVDNIFEGTVNRDQSSGGNAIEVRTDGSVTIENNDLSNVTSENGDLLFTASKSTNVTTNNNTGL